MKEEILKKWRVSPVLRQAKRILNDSPPEQWLQNIGRLNKLRLRRVVGWLTGHWWVRYYLYKRTILNEGNCRWCRGQRSKPSISSAGARLLWVLGGGHGGGGGGGYFLQPETLREQSLQSICQVIERMDRRLQRSESYKTTKPRGTVQWA